MLATTSWYTPPLMTVKTSSLANRRAKRSDIASLYRRDVALNESRVSLSVCLAMLSRSSVGRLSKPVVGLEVESIVAKQGIKSCMVGKCSSRMLNSC